MDDNLKFILLSPLNAENLHLRQQSALLLRDNIKNVAKMFLDYTNCGKILCKGMTDLAKAFDSFTSTENDPTITSISHLLSSFRETFENSYDRIQNTIIPPLQEFVKNDISAMEAAAKHAEETTHEYLESVSKYQNAQNKKKNNLDDLLASLMHHQSEAVQATFNFDSTLDLIERKKLIEITGTFLAFTEMTASSYRECVFNYDELKDNFNALRAALPESTNSIRTFRQSSLNWSTTLDRCLMLYWKRFSIPFPGTTTLDHEGLLWKKGSGFTKNWNRHYFTIKNHLLSYYRDNETEPAQQLQLLFCSAKSLESPDRSNCFQVTMNNGTEFTLQAATEWDKNEWMQVIQNNIQNALDTTDQEEPQQTINTTCADCGAPHPTWCSINWGVCICIHCSGVHRSLGANKSKVRSLTLDRLDAKTLQLFSDIGNDRANSVLEANAQGKPPPTATKEERIAYITKKYNMEFVNKHSVDVVKAIREDNVMDVFDAVAQRLIQPASLYFAAATGSATICQLVAMNLPNFNVLDSGGWSALSYAAYYGNSAAAETFLMLGMDPAASTTAHPYAIAMTRNHTGLAALLSPFWHGKETDLQIRYTPPTQVVQSSHRRSVTRSIAKLPTLSIIGI